MVGVGAMSVVGSVVESHLCPCLCLDALSLSNIRSNGDLGLYRNLVGSKKSRRQSTLSSSFVDAAWNEWHLSAKVLSGIVRGYSRRRRRIQKMVVVSEIAGQYDDNFEDVTGKSRGERGRRSSGIGILVSFPCSQWTTDGYRFCWNLDATKILHVLNYFTIKAVRTVLNQLYEMNPPQYRWFYDFIRTNEPGDGKQFIRNLGKERHELAERVMITRLHLYGKWSKKCDHAKIYQYISDQNLELMRERLMDTVIWPSDDTNTETIG